MNESEKSYRHIEAEYNLEAEESGWFGPEVIFGLTFKYIQPGQSILDIGTGTGLAARLYIKGGLQVYGIDISERMLGICASKGFRSLEKHDITKRPYPYPDSSIDHAVCTGVMHFYNDLSAIFHEVSRIIRPGGVFGFVTGATAGSADEMITIDADREEPEKEVTIHLHSRERITGWLNDNGFREQRSLPFTVFRDRERSEELPARAYAAIRNAERG